MFALEAVDAVVAGSGASRVGIRLPPVMPADHSADGKECRFKPANTKTVCTPGAVGCADYPVRIRLRKKQRNTIHWLARQRRLLRRGSPGCDISHVSKRSAGAGGKKW